MHIYVPGIPMQFLLSMKKAEKNNDDERNCDSDFRGFSLNVDK